MKNSYFPKQHSRWGFFFFGDAVCIPRFPTETELIATATHPMACTVFLDVRTTVGFNPTRSVDVFMCMFFLNAASVGASRQDELLPRRPTKCLVALFINSENGRLYVDGMEREIFATLCSAYKCLV
jgi:hypothetical protein